MSLQLSTQALRSHTPMAFFGPHPYLSFNMLFVLDKGRSGRKADAFEELATKNEQSSTSCPIEDNL